MWRNIILGVGSYAERMIKLSRSYKKHNICKDKCWKTGKKLANRIVRMYEDIIPKGAAYKKLYCTWNVCDYKVRISWQEYCRETNLKQLVKGSPEYKKLYRQWYKWYKGK